MILRCGSLLCLLMAFALGCTRAPDIRVEPLTGMQLVRIHPGSFEMGEEGAQRTVRLQDAFWMGRTEVTQAQWEAVMGRGEPHPEKPSPYRGKFPDYPVVSISYVEVQEFLKRLNAQTQGGTYRLPTESEWEYACRAGTTTAFSVGPRLTDTDANFNAEIPSAYAATGTYLGHPAPVGSYPPNPWGLYDMHGNVWEWVSDGYAGPAAPEKVIRGGSWYYGAENARSASRRAHHPELWGFSIGFRVVYQPDHSSH